MPTDNTRMGEMIPKRTPNSKTWINLDGSYTTELFQGVVHFEDEHGNLQNINTDLMDESNLDAVDVPVSREGKGRFKEARAKAKERKAKNTLDRDQFDYQGLFLPFELKVPKNFMRGYTIGKGADKLTFKPVKASPAKGYVDPAIKNVIRYQDVWNDTDVALEVLPSGIKETLFLKTDRAPAEFLFEVTGGIGDDLRTEQMRLEPAWLIDAAGERRDVAQVLAVEGNKKFIKLTADLAGLVYPIEIDPTVIIEADRVGAGKETYIHENSPSSNYGNNSTMGIGRSASKSMRSLIQFDLSTIPSNAEVRSAILKLSISSGYGSGTVYTSKIHEIKSAWNQDTVNWSNQPAIGTTVWAQHQTYSGTMEVDIADLADEWVKGYRVNNGLMILGDEVGAYTYRYFHTSDFSTNNSVFPELVLEYNIRPNTPNIISPNGGENWNAEHLISWQPSTDAISTTLYTPLSADARTSFSNYLIGQVFENQYDNNKITKAGILINSNIQGPQNITIELVGINPADKLPNGIVYSSNVVPISTFSSPQFVYATLDVPISLPKGTLIGIQLKGPLTYSVDVNVNNDNNANFNKRYSKTSPGGAWIIDTAYSMVFSIEYKDGAKQEEIQYQVDLSTDDGATWKTLQALTAPGATSLAYNFTSEPETSVASVSIRAFDGTSYSDWDESSGVFSIVHNKAPGTPINLTPTGGLVKDRALPIRLSWLHNDPDAGDPQSKFDLQWRKKGTTAWNDVSAVTINQFHDLNGLTHGEHEWRVRTYDQAGLSSAYSDIALFLAGDKPAAATIVSPVNGAAIAVANPTVQWSSDSQSAYKLMVKDAGVTVWTDEKVSLNKAVTIGTDLQNQKAYTVELSIKNTDGLWSNLTQITINVSYTPPAMPTFSAIGQSQAATIRLTIGAPLPSGTEPSVTHHDIYRRKQGDSAWDRIMTGAPANGSYVDATPGSGQVYEYYARAWGNNGTYRDSMVVSSSITLLSMWLLDPMDPESLHRFHYFEPGRSAERAFQGALMEFEGRKQYMAEFSEREQNKVNVVLQLKKDSDDLAALHDLLGRRTALLYRDAKGRRIFGSIFVLTENETDYGYTVPLEVQAVDYKEEV